MDLLGDDYCPPAITPANPEPDEFELFIRKAEAFSAARFLEKAEFSTISTQSEQSIQNSITVQEQFISENLADLLAAQSKIKQAVKMYQKLAAQQPPKSDYYRQKIANLIQK